MTTTKTIGHRAQQGFYQCADAVSEIPLRRGVSEGNCIGTMLGGKGGEEVNISFQLLYTHIQCMMCVGSAGGAVMAMVRYQMFIDEGQKRMLEEMHRRMNVPVAELVRRAIDSLVAEQPKTPAYPVLDEETGSLLSLAGVCEGGPNDLADSHEQYLRGEKNP
jgi:hypothetical protein